jgi:glucoside 3-dehydrogenase (cytochrome c) hitch-hiker subunit
MNRREVLRLMAVGAAASAARPSWAGPAPFTPHQAETVAAIAEQIIPQTESAGAKAAGVPAFIGAVIADADMPERDRFLHGLDEIDVQTRAKFGVQFVSASAAQQTMLLQAISATDFFKTIKTLTITGYYTSRLGMREELGDDGRTIFPDYAGCMHDGHGATD